MLVFLSDKNSNDCSILHHLRYSQNKWHTLRLTLKIKVIVKDEKNWPCDIRQEMLNSIYVNFRTLGTWENTFTQKDTKTNTLTHTHVNIACRNACVIVGIEL